jgi:hypothetical protein
MFTVNKKVAVTPFPTTDTETQVVAGRVVLKQRSELTPLKVVFDSDGDLVAGRTVYVRGDLCKHQLAKEIFEKDDKKFILIDENMVIGYDP